MSLSRPAEDSGKTRKNSLILTSFAALLLFKKPLLKHMWFMTLALVDLKKARETCWDAGTNQTLKRFRNSNEEKLHIFFHLFLLCFPENVKLKQCSAENAPLVMSLRELLPPFPGL